MTRTRTVIAAVLTLLGILLLSLPAATIAEEAAVTVPQPSPEHAEHATGQDAFDLEKDSRRRSSEYIFGMTKAIRRSTLYPALKPAVWLVTIPLDIVLLPFAAIGGLF